MIRRFNPFLSFTRTYFLAPDGGDGGAGGSGADAGGATAVADPPADANADVIGFQPPGIDDAIREISGKPAAPDPAKPADPKPDPKAQPAKPDQKKPAGEPPAAQLRKELDTVKVEREAARAELTELKKKLETGDPRLTEAQNALKAKDQEIETFRKQLSDYEVKLKLGNPAVREKLSKLDTSYNQESEKFFRGVTEIDQPTLNSLVREYAQLPFGKPEYKEARNAFETNLQDRLGSDRKLERVLGFIERTYDFIGERAEAQGEIERDAGRLAHEAEVKEYSGKKTHVSKLIEDAKSLPERMAKENPEHPGSFIHEFMKSLPDEKQKLVDDGIDLFVEKVLAGTAPKSDDDFAGMHPRDAAAARAAEQEHLGKVRDQAATVMVNGLRALRLLPALVKDWKRLQEKVGEEAGALPPDPASGTPAGSGTEGDDLKTYQAPDLSNLRL